VEVIEEVEINIIIVEQLEQLEQQELNER